MAGGQQLTSKTINYDIQNNKIILDAENVTWPNSTIIARYAIIFIDKGDPSISPLLGFIDFGQDVGSINGNFSLIWDDNGIFNITVN